MLRLKTCLAIPLKKLWVKSCIHLLFLIDIGKHIKGLKTFINTGQGVHIGETLELEALKRDGSEFPVELSLSSVNVNGKWNAVGIVRDIRKRKQVEEQLKRSYAIQNIMNSVLRVSLEPISLKKQLERILDMIISIPWIAFQSKGCIFLIEDAPKTLIMKVQHNFAASQITSCSRIPLGKCLCGQVASTRELLFVHCVDEHHEIHYKDMPPHGHYCVPVLSGDKMLGIINLYLKEGHKRNQEEEEFLFAVASSLAGIIERKQAGEALQTREKDLKEKTQHLEETNVALKVLLQQRENDKKEIEESIVSNAKNLILPSLEKLKKSRSDGEQKTYIDLVESYVRDITSPLIRELSSKYVNLTPTEIRVAGLIKEGKTTKEIADLLSLSNNTILTYRNHIRSKLGIKSENINLRSYLQTFIKQ